NIDTKLLFKPIIILYSDFSGQNWAQWNVQKVNPSQALNNTSNKQMEYSERKFQCNLCLKRFKQNNHLRYHMNIHSGEKPFRCSVCNEGFNAPYGLKRHEKKHKQAENIYHI
ncbi:unnamed protein product, partial [Owenia fusiformis]